MEIVNMFEAKTGLSRLVEAVATGRQREIILARNGQPAARLVPLDEPVTSQRIGVAKGKFEVPDDIDTHNDEVAQLFGCEAQP
ncbi:MAG: prevent-host-death protein [Gammaproteobacteria bacterium]|nr:prevent-host-death protein [Gammaproteobacteria bacterium]